MKWWLCPHKKPRIRYSASGVWEEAFLVFQAYSLPRFRCPASSASAAARRPMAAAWRFRDERLASMCADYPASCRYVKAGCANIPCFPSGRSIGTRMVVFYTRFMNKGSV